MSVVARCCSLSVVVCCLFSCLVVVCVPLWFAVVGCWLLFVFLFVRARCSFVVRWLLFAVVCCALFAAV